MPLFFYIIDFTKFCGTIALLVSNMAIFDHHKLLMFHFIIRHLNVLKYGLRFFLFALSLFRFCCPFCFICWFFFWSFSQLFSSLLSFHFKERSRKLSDARENEHHRGYDRKWREFSGPITARRKVNALLETVLQLNKIFSLFLDRNHKTGGSLEWSSVSTKSWHFSKFPSHFFFSLVFSYFQFTTALAITEGSVD